MKLRGGPMFALGTIISACAIHINDGTPPPQPPAPAPAPAPAPPPAPAPRALPAPAPAGAPVTATRPQSLVLPRVDRPAPAAAAPQAAAVQNPPPASTGRRTISHISPAFYARMEPLNVTFLQQAKARQPRACGPAEVAPGVWVRIDCHNYQPIAAARAHWSVRKAKAVTKSRKNVHLGLRGALTAQSSSQSSSEKAGMPRVGVGAGGGAAGAGALDGDFPETVDHRTSDFEGPIKNQGYVGACTAFSLSTAMDNAVRRAGGNDVISPTHLWSHYGSPHMSLAGDANLNKSIATFETWPYSGKEACQLSTETDDDCGEAYGVRPGTAKNDPVIRAALAKAEASGVQKIVAIESLAVSPPDINEIKSVLASGSDLWIAMRIGSSWMGRLPNGAVIADWSSFEGGHAIVMSGYRKTPAGTHQFLIHNSWGDSWGDHGYAWVSEAMVNRWLSYAYKVKLENGVAPTPGQMTDDDCADDELIDSVTGQCAKMCADDSRAAGGKCGGDGAASRPKPAK